MKTAKMRFTAATTALAAALAFAGSNASAAPGATPSLQAPVGSDDAGVVRSAQPADVPPVPPEGDAQEQDGFTCSEVWDWTVDAWSDMMKELDDAIFWLRSVGAIPADVWEEYEERKDEYEDWAAQRERVCRPILHPGGGHPLYPGTSDGSEGGPAF